ncbi:MAG: hypothetical protein J3Q66DRAFT_389550 [Benniella sp.]|nr:MAG: hypothetical protein J3Q66DRAFT_389550 [Benniella sp.]
MASSSLDIPQIDITPLLSDDDGSSASDERQKVAAQLLHAFTTYGVFYITSPGHPAFASNKILDASKRLFALDDDHKAQIPKIQPGGFTRGYVPIGGESGSQTKELKEGFSYGYEWSEEKLKEHQQQQQQQQQQAESPNRLLGENSWPTLQTLALLDQGIRGGGGSEGEEEEGEKDAFKKVLIEFYLNVCGVAKGLLKGISLALKKPEEELAKYCATSETISFMRLFHYLPYQDQQHTSQIGSSAHTDWGFLTLILSPSKTVGLQLFHENAWHDVPSVENTLVVNGGDYLSLLTRGQLISPLHRVVSNGQEERYSMCCFYYPDYHAKIPLLVEEKEQVKGQAASGSYSLLRDQRSEEEKATEAASSSGQDGHPQLQGDAQSVADDLLSGKINFGDYIVGKWTQVYRKGGY